MITTVREQYQHCIEHQYTYMAHCLHYLLKERLICLEDEFMKVDFNQVNQEKVREMAEQNYLCFQPIKLYSLKIGDYLWVFVFAATKEEAWQYTKMELKRTPKNCMEYDMGFEMEKGNRVLSFREMKNECESFPAVAGYFEKETVYR